MEKQNISPITLKDLMGDNYEVEQYLTEDDMQIIRNVFKDKNVLKVLRKVLLPSIADSNLPLEEAIGKDVWNVGRDWGMIPTEQIKGSLIGAGAMLKSKVGNARKSMKNIVAGMFNFAELPGVITPESGEHVEITEAEVKTPKVSL